MFYQLWSILSGLSLDQNNHEDSSPNEILLRFLTFCAGIGHVMSSTRGSRCSLFCLIVKCAVFLGLRIFIMWGLAAKAVSIKSLQYFHLFLYCKCDGALDCILCCICIRVLAPWSGCQARFSSLNQEWAGKRYRVCKAFLKQCQGLPASFTPVAFWVFLCWSTVCFHYPHHTWEAECQQQSRLFLLLACILFPAAPWTFHIPLRRELNLSKAHV